MAGPIILIDGGSGAGKTSLAHRLATLADGTHVVSLDDFYPGWDGLAAGTAMVLAFLRDLAVGYDRWDWEQDRPGVHVDLPTDGALIIEGCGAITPDTVALADLSIWMEVPAPIRRRRALDRDGDRYAPHWQRWADQEAEHWRRHEPWRLADLTVTGDADFDPVNQRTLECRVASCAGVADDRAEGPDPVRREGS